jgi:topoisomerase-4 subunit B
MRDRRVLPGRAGFPNGQGSVEVGGRLAAVERGRLVLLLQHHPDAGRRHARAGHPLAPDARPARFGELAGQKKAKDFRPRTWSAGPEIMLSVFIRDPQFQSQTKDRLTSPDAARLVETAIRDHFDHFLADHMERGPRPLGFILDRMDERLKRRPSAR